VRDFWNTDEYRMEFYDLCILSGTVSNSFNVILGSLALFMDAAEQSILYCILVYLCMLRLHFDTGDWLGSLKIVQLVKYLLGTTSRNVVVSRNKFV